MPARDWLALLANIRRIAARQLTYIALATVALVLVVGKLAYNAYRDSHDDTRRTVLSERVRVDTLRDKSDSIALVETRRQLDAALARGVTVVERWNNSPSKPIATGTAHDSVAQLTTQVNACRADGNALAKSVLGIKSSCEAYRDTATKSLRDKDEKYARLDSLYQLGRKEKRIQSYGDLLYEPLKRRPIVGLGVTSRMFWRVDAKAEAQYAIPHAVRDSSDGFRFTVGAHVRF